MRNRSNLVRLVTLAAALAGAPAARAAGDCPTGQVARAAAPLPKTAAAVTKLADAWEAAEKGRAPACAERLFGEFWTFYGEARGAAAVDQRAAAELARVGDAWLAERFGDRLPAPWGDYFRTRARYGKLDTDDGHLAITWKQLRESLLAWEALVARSAAFSQRDDVALRADEAFRAFLVGLQRSPIYAPEGDGWGGPLLDDVRAEYEAYLAVEPRPAHYKAVKAYYDRLKKRGFKVSSTDPRFLERYGVASGE